ncbi:zinc finger protein 184-like [Armigeres subalbatus]|uniref:zinc finger protein 184-like n=1 Tax=Armigeres subalbatus TaxID=124917 RepID=UPI002ED3C678
MDRYCRVCMAKNCAELISLFQIHESEDDVIANMIIDCTEVMVSDDDNLPQNICGKCMIRLNQAYELRKQCQRSDEAFRAMLLQGVSSSVQIEPTCDSFQNVQTEESSEAVSKTFELEVQVEGIDEEQNVEYLDEDEDYHEYIDSTKNIKTESSVEHNTDAKTHTGVPLNPENVSKVDEFDQYSVFYVQGKRCCGCQMVFSNIESLFDHCKHAHYKEHDGYERKFLCDICNKGFDTKQLLVTHKDAAKSNKLYYCKLCNCFLGNELSFMEHIFVEGHEEVMYSFKTSDKFESMLITGFRCCGCDTIYSNEPDLEIHIAEKHLPTTTSFKNIEVIHCSKCYKTFNERQELEQHQSEIHHYSYHCRIGDCKYTTIHKKHIINHVTMTSLHRNTSQGSVKTSKKNSNTEDEDSRFCCCIVRCHESFQSKSELLKHAVADHEILRIQHTQDRKHSTIVCNICLKGFENEQAYNRHQSSNKSIHHVCRKCGAKYASKATLKQHERSNCGKIAQYQCTKCDKAFMSLGGFHNHQQVHNSKRSHVCNICGRGFLRKGILKDHMNSVHANTRFFKCMLCSKSFASRNIFQAHQLTHTKTKAYQCRYCEKRYYKTSDRTMHENQVHLGIRPFKCNFCTTSFIRDRERRLHERIHTKGKLYSCDLCSEGYNKFAEYKMHRLSEHGLDTLRDLGSVIMTAIRTDQNSEQSASSS